MSGARFQLQQVPLEWEMEDSTSHYGRPPRGRGRGRGRTPRGRQLPSAQGYQDPSVKRRKAFHEGPLNQLVSDAGTSQIFTGIPVLGQLPPHHASFLFPDGITWQMVPVPDPPAPPLGSSWKLVQLEEGRQGHSGTFELLASGPPAPSQRLRPTFTFPGPPVWQQGPASSQQYVHRNMAPLQEDPPVQTDAGWAVGPTVVSKGHPVVQPSTLARGGMEWAPQSGGKEDHMGPISILGRDNEYHEVFLDSMVPHSFLPPGSPSSDDDDL